jgi:hypothetical protein
MAVAVRRNGNVCIKTRKTILEIYLTLSCLIKLSRLEILFWFENRIPVQEILAGTEKGHHVTWINANTCEVRLLQSVLRNDTLNQLSATWNH